ncbi:hypothetical protein A3Q40_03316 [Rhodococcus sp. PBTS 1]|nr:hypothetical protein A3Q40_03316 [Rhodococcus sp. PBTS 1]
MAVVDTAVVIPIAVTLVGIGSASADFRDLTSVGLNSVNDMSIRPPVCADQLTLRGHRLTRRSDAADTIGP